MPHQDVGLEGPRRDVLHGVPRQRQQLLPQPLRRQGLRHGVRAVSGVLGGRGAALGGGGALASYAYAPALSRARVDRDRDLIATSGRMRPGVESNSHTGLLSCLSLGMADGMTGARSSLRGVGLLLPVCMCACDGGFGSSVSRRTLGLDESVISATCRPPIKPAVDRSKSISKSSSQVLDRSSTPTLDDSSPAFE